MIKQISETGNLYTYTMTNIEFFQGFGIDEAGHESYLPQVETTQNGKRCVCITYTPITEFKSEEDMIMVEYTWDNYTLDEVVKTYAVEHVVSSPVNRFELMEI